MKTICLGTTEKSVPPTIWSTAARVEQAFSVTPSSDEQRRLTIVVRNIQHLAAYRLKKAALEYAKVHAPWTPRTIILTQGSIHGA